MKKGCRWSKINKHLKSYICPKLNDRVEFTIAVYRKSHDQAGRISILVDKKEVFSMSTIKAEIEDYKLCKKLEEELGHIKTDKEIYHICEEQLYSRGIFGEYEFYKGVEEYFSINVQDSLNSNNILLNILALIDRRVGKRSLQRFYKEYNNKHEIVKYFFRLRCEVESMSLNLDK